jgi:hypothetical protein
MPSPLHEALVRLFTHSPHLAVDALREAASVAVPRHRTVRVADSKLGHVRSPEFHADLVLVFEDEGPRFVLVVEVVRQVRPERRRRWTLCLASLAEAYGCDVCLLVVATTRPVAAWARAPIHLGPMMTWSPVVLDASLVPTLAVLEEGKPDAAKVLLSAAMHVREARDVETLMTLLASVPEGMDAIGGMSGFLRLLVEVLPDRLRPLRNEKFMGKGMEETNPIADRIVALWEQEGFEKGRVEGVREVLLGYVGDRGWTLTPEQMQTLSACTDTLRLRGWLNRLLAGHGPDEAFAG